MSSSDWPLRVGDPQGLGKVGVWGSGQWVWLESYSASPVVASDPVGSVDPESALSLLVSVSMEA